MLALTRFPLPDPAEPLSFIDRRSMDSSPPKPTFFQRPSKSADEARLAEIARDAALTPRQRVLLALRLGRLSEELANGSAPDRT